METSPPSDRFQDALADGDRAAALALCPGLVDEHLPEQRRLRRTAETLARLDEATFRREQAAAAERIAAAVEARDRAAVLGLIETKREAQYRPLRDALIEYKASSYDWHLAALGPVGLFACQRHVAETQRAGFTKWEEATVEDHVRQASRIFALHLGRTTVVEEPDRYRIVLDPCGTGGRMAVSGSLTRPGIFHARVPGAHSFTLGRESFPAYCCHCFVWNELAAAEWFGHPQWVFSPWEKPGEPCGFSIYKDPNDIPAEHYATLGLSKPAELPRLRRAEQRLTAGDLALLGTLPSDRLWAAVEAEEWETAARLCSELAKEYVLMVKGLRLVLEALAEYDEAAFRREQTSLAGAIRVAVDSGDDTLATWLLERKQVQHESLRDLTSAFVEQSYDFHNRLLGEAGLAACRQQVAEEMGGTGHSGLRNGRTGAASSAPTGAPR